MKFNRASGIILHPTSLPGPCGIGDIGPEAIAWVDFLTKIGCGLWQILPLGPTGYGDSPYQCFSAFAGNPYLVSPQSLLEDGLLSQGDLDERPFFPEGRVDFGAVIPWKLALLDRAYANFERSASLVLRQASQQFQQSQADWLEDFALFMALKEYHGGAPWSTWTPPLRDRQPEALDGARGDLHTSIQRQMFRQFIFFRQWSQLHDFAAGHGIRIIGDIPIFVAHDSADVWAHPELFALDKTGQPTLVAGVPPDYFSPTGQLWGNPLYRWDAHKETGYAWWLERMRSVLSLVDIVRLDHFRGFAGYWEVPGGDKTAENGRWVPGPGKGFFAALEDALGTLPIIAEDLGVITPDVVALREEFHLPGMRILQFAFSMGVKEYLPHYYIENCVVYTGTHDNDTVRGWYDRAPEEEKSYYRRYLARDGRDVSWDMIRACWGSVAAYAIAPLQDLLSLGNEARMNYPGNPSGNWAWRMPAGCLDEALQARVKEINFLYDRLNEAEPSEEQAPPPIDYF